MMEVFLLPPNNCKQVFCAHTASAKAPYLFFQPIYVVEVQHKDQSHESKADVSERQVFKDSICSYIKKLWREGRIKVHKFSFSSGLDQLMDMLEFHKFNFILSHRNNRFCYNWEGSLRKSKLHDIGIIQFLEIFYDPIHIKKP